MSIVVVEDDLVGRLAPITLSRPAYAISCGGYRLIDWLERWQQPLRAIVRPHLAELQQLDFPQFQGPRAGLGRLLLVNARLVPGASVLRRLRALSEGNATGAFYWRDELAAALLTTDAWLTSSDPAKLSDQLRLAGIDQLPRHEADLPLFQYPHDVVAWNMQILGENLEDRIGSGAYREVADGVFAAEGAALGEYVVTDTRSGPIVLDAGASIGPYTLLRGPAYLGARAKVIEHSAIKDHVSVGHTVKIGGEVEASIIEPYTNKQHHGFLGHSYLGSWINLGAGTCNSDLKNTYGYVKMDYRGEAVATGMQFMGCVVGDYSKSAINTSIFTGKVIGACSMLYGFVTTNVPSFVNYARSFGQVTELPAEIMVATQQRMFARRQVAQRPCDARLLHAMYELTRHERQLAGEPLSL
jgi:UDP-N-acetylglucosamine diphosphorylase / glucose-1-phosphate thymidylyltransferase / UDP-N-acetylgalactosamine diphosphorylase / glucosamine-1-phosphate N-acetyltransferase / galactosamine-1-phosphate N-acetyltransferase